ncbi:adenylate/guanylate cyclase domain-containing protein [Candidatus Gracilibacteria bacterium]|nr:adenylate/guanylate cyclase domain-containing protein [Candidatus Gracilibacteria bacterium]
MRTSISRINRLLIGCFSVLNLGLIVFMTHYAQEDRIDIYLFVIIMVNFGMITLYLFLNSKYWDEHTRLFQHFSTFIRDKKDPDKMPQDEQFTENAEFLSLFKRTYVENKLLKKDYTDFKKVFDTFIPQEIHSKIGFRGYERIVLGTAERRRLTIMFLDIMKFTTVSESIADPYRALLLLNIYFDGIGDIIYSHHGYIDKYLGDGMLVIFDDDHTDDAIHAAIEIQEFIRKFQISTIGRYIDIGIGINTGSVIMGTIGTKRRMDATVIGDVVNTASRIESLTRDNPYHIIITKDTHDAIVNRQLFSLHNLGETTLRGKNIPIELYGVDMFERVELPDGMNIK